MTLDHLLENNRLWVREFYGHATSDRQTRTPRYCWIGCCDGPFGIAPRLGLEPRDLFIHRNLANIVCSLDTNGLAALQYAVDVLEVQHIIVCGHSKCRGVLAATNDEPLGLTDHWVSEIMELPEELGSTGEYALDAEKATRLSIRNVQAQVSKLCHLRMVRDAWQRDQALSVHGWMYDDDTGLFRTLRSNTHCVDTVVPSKALTRDQGSARHPDERIKSHDATTA